MLKSIRDGHKLAYLCGALLLAMISVLFNSGITTAVSAPNKINADYQPYYYVAKGVADNGQFPATWIGFYWDSPGSKTINYDAMRCSDGGYGNNNRGLPNITFYRLNSNGSINEGSIIAGTFDVSGCSSGTKSYNINIDGSSYDGNIGKYGVAVRVGVSDSSARTRAWFNLSTPDGDGADYGAMGGKPLGYSRDLKSAADGGWYYDIETGFGSCDATSATNQTIQFFDIDNSTYQASQSLRAAVYNNNTGQWVPNTSASFVGLNNVNRHSGYGDYWFNVTGNSAEYASITLNTAPKTGYRLKIIWIREGNDISIQVPSNEIYSKKACMPKWTLSTNTIVNKPIAVPGETVAWTHTVINDGPDHTSTTGQTVVSRYQNVNNVGSDTWDDGTRDNNHGLIRARSNRNYCVDVQDGSVSSGARIRSWDCNDSGAQQFIPFSSDNSLRNGKSNLCLDAIGGGGAGTNIQLHGCNGSVAQRWIYNSSTGEIYYQSASSGLCLDRRGNQYSDGDLQVWNCNNLDNQKWIIDNSARTFDTSWRGSNNPGTTGTEGKDYMLAGSTRTFQSTYTVKPEDIGKTLCRRTSANGTAYNNSNWLFGPIACVSIPYNYEAVPKTRADKTDVKLGDTVEFTYSVENKGPTQTVPLGYRAYAFVLKSGENINSVISGPRAYTRNASDEFINAACGGRDVASPRWKYCQNRVVGGTTDATGAEIVINSGNSKDINTFSITANSGVWAADPGDKICSYVVVNLWKFDNGTRADSVSASNIQCVGIDKNPQLQIRGADSWSGGSWANADGTEYSNNGGFQGYAQSVAERGSWSQYGLLADKGSINGFGSAGYTVSLPIANQTKGCQLIFANTSSSVNCPTYGGGLNSGSSLTHKISLPKEATYTDSQLNTITPLSTSFYNYFAADGYYRTINLANLPSGTYLLPSDHPFLIQGDGCVGGYSNNCTISLGPGKKITLVSKGDIYMDSNVTPSATTYSSMTSVPEFTVIAKGKISVASHSWISVKSLYGTYISTNGMYTCHDETLAVQSGAGLRNGNDNCGQQLRINGSLISRESPRFLRTIGSGLASVNIVANGETHSDASTAAEIINYQPNLFLTPYLDSKNSSDATWVTTKQTVLPARF